MRLKNKQSKKDLESKIVKLEADNKYLTKQLDSLKSLENNPKTGSVEKYLTSEQVDILLYSKENNKISALFPRTNLTVLHDFPDTLEKFVSIFSEDDQESVRNLLLKEPSRENLRFQAKIKQIRDGDKETHFIEVLKIKTEDPNSIIVLKDVADLSKQRRELVRVKEKVEESDKLKSTLLSNISHQIRTPLNSITGFAELMANTDIELRNRKDYIDIIKRQSKRILNLIDDISEISKLESGSINISKIPCNLTLLLNELLLGLNQQRTENRKSLVKLELVLPDSGTYDIVSDSGRLQQVLLNIINYCQRYTHKGKIQFGYTIDEENQKIKFFVSDTSDGLTKDEQKVLFNRFMIIENTESVKYEDAGLGLTIAREIVKAMGGKIWVESEPGKGTNFYFTIPLHVKDDKSEQTSVDETGTRDDYNWSNKVILIVDDEEVNAMFLEAVVQDTNVQTIFAKNGQQAVELVKNIHKIDLILMDLKMPVMNGLEATREIRKINKHLPVIAQTALASEEDKNDCLEAGCNGTITKPIEVEELLILLNKYLSD